MSSFLSFVYKASSSLDLSFSLLDFAGRNVALDEFGCRKDKWSYERQVNRAR
jgi:hypothetical protein